jgi:hypothetical protein
MTTTSVIKEMNMIAKETNFFESVGVAVAGAADSSFNSKNIFLNDYSTSSCQGPPVLPALKCGVR